MGPDKTVLSVCVSARLFCRLVAYGPNVTSPVLAAFPQPTDPLAERPLAVITPALTAPEQAMDEVVRPAVATTLEAFTCPEQITWVVVMPELATI